MDLSLVKKSDKDIWQVETIEVKHLLVLIKLSLNR